MLHIATLIHSPLVIQIFCSFFLPLSLSVPLSRLSPSLCLVSLCLSASSLSLFIFSSHRGYFVDLYVRKSNAVAIGMYRKFGYTVYREVIGYYMGEENAYDMRKALSRDVGKKSIIPLPHPVPPGEFD